MPHKPQWHISDSECWGTELSLTLLSLTLQPYTRFVCTLRTNMTKMYVGPQETSSVRIAVTGYCATTTQVHRNQSALRSHYSLILCMIRHEYGRWTLAEKTWPWLLYAIILQARVGYKSATRFSSGSRIWPEWAQQAWEYLLYPAPRTTVLTVVNKTLRKMNGGT